MSEPFKYMLWSRMRGGATELLLKETLASFVESGKQSIEVTFKYEHANPEEIKDAERRGREEILARLPESETVTQYVVDYLEEHGYRPNEPTLISWLRNRLKGET